MLGTTNMSRLIRLIPILLLAGCSTAPVQQSAPINEAITHVEVEALARKSGDFSAVESKTFRALKSEATQSDWDALVELEFAGKYRRDAKTSYATKGSKLIAFEPFESVSELINDINSVSEEQSVKATYKESTGKSLNARDNNEPRLDVEKRNVKLIGYIRAVKWVAKEDQDFHVMVCEGQTNDGHPCFTTEVSGLPKTGVRIIDFRRARKGLIDAMRDFVDETDPAKPLKPTNLKDKWAFFEPGIHVEVSGSLYLDAIHQPGSVGPRPSTNNTRDHTTSTAWEIHPVWSVRRLVDE